VPLFTDVQRLAERFEELCHEKVRYITAAGDEARTAGFAEGKTAGQRAGRDELAEALAEMTRAAAAERDRLRGEVGVLALQVVRKLIGQVAPDAVLAGLAAAAVRDMLPTQTLTLFVHPDQTDAVRARLAAATDHGDGPENSNEARIDVQADPNCEPGSCRIETEHGTVDASLETQLARLADAWR
jgi:type III secretion system HrpE/YscL family protein